MTSDAITVLNDIPFSIPPYFALLGRAIVTLEGIALTGDPSYGIIMEAYPFVARKLLSEDRPEIQRALQQVLYSTGQSNGDGLQATREIKASGETKTIPIIALTANAMDEHRKEAREAGCDEYETKPVRLPSLIEKIENLT